MVMGKLGAFLNKDVGRLVEEARKVLNTDLGALAKGAGRATKAELAELSLDKVAADKPLVQASKTVEASSAPIAEQFTPAQPTAAPAYDPDVTQKMDRATFTGSAATHATPDTAQAMPAFDPDVTQKLDRAPVATTASGDSGSAQPFDPDVTQKLDRSAALPPSSSPSSYVINATKFSPEMLQRLQREAPVGNDVNVLLPTTVGDFKRPQATPSGELTTDPVNAVYADKGETVQLQLTRCWDADEAGQEVERIITMIGTAAHTPSDHGWVIGPTPQGTVFAWHRDCYFFCATSRKGAPALARFLSVYSY